MTTTTISSETTPNLDAKQPHVARATRQAQGQQCVRRFYDLSRRVLAVDTRPLQVRMSACICRRERSTAAACGDVNTSVGGGGGRRRAVSVRVRPLFLRAPRLVPLRLPAAFFDDDDEGNEDEVSGLSAGDNDGEDDDDPFAMRRFSASSDGLAPLHGLPPLQALPELDAAFQNLFVF